MLQVRKNQLSGRVPDFCRSVQPTSLCGLYFCVPCQVIPFGTVMVLLCFSIHRQSHELWQSGLWQGVDRSAYLLSDLILSNNFFGGGIPASLTSCFFLTSLDLV